MDLALALFDYFLGILVGLWAGRRIGVRAVAKSNKAKRASALRRKPKKQADKQFPLGPDHVVTSAFDPLKDVPLFDDLGPPDVVPVEEAPDSSPTRGGKDGGKD